MDGNGIKSKALEVMPIKSMEDQLNNSSLKISMEYVMNNYNVDHSVKLFTFIASLWKAIKDSVSADGKITFSKDISNFILPLEEAFPAFGGDNINYITKELFDKITVEEQKQLLAPFKERGLLDVNKSEPELVSDIFNWIEASKTILRKYIIKNAG